MDGHGLHYGFKLFAHTQIIEELEMGPEISLSATGLMRLSHTF